MATRRTTFDGQTTDIYSSALDPTNQKQAVTQQDVAGQDYATRLWQSLNYTYGQQRDQSNKQYDQAISATDRAALQRGMGRSSFTTQTLANMGKQKTDAWNNIYNAQVADYQTRLTEQQNFERQFEQQQKTADQQLAAGYVNAIISAGGTPSDDLLKRAGLSRADALAMIQKPQETAAASGRSGGSWTPKPTSTDDEGDGTENPGDMSDDDFMKFMNGLLGNNTPRKQDYTTPKDKKLAATSMPSANPTAAGNKLTQALASGTQTPSTAPMDPSKKWFTGRDQYQDSTVLNPHNRREKIILR